MPSFLRTYDRSFFEKRVPPSSRGPRLLTPFLRTVERLDVSSGIEYKTISLALFPYAKHCFSRWLTSWKLLGH